ncbi:histidine phosphatase family protein [Corticibacterium sp. UT-5YL-CI-8]|nr:histidine phosphatase family protein [Tianweitania sp. UT-5YL-CI-8]
MNTLYLLRHAKTGWALPGMRDFDRPLEESGIRDAETLGRTLQELDYIPSMTICSTALRARQTLEAVAGQTDTGRVVFTERLYHDDAAGYLAVIRENGGKGSLLVVGHNPMMEDLAEAHAPSGDADALATLRAGFPTCGLAVIDFPVSLSVASLGAGRLRAFLAPGDL